MTSSEPLDSREVRERFPGPAGGEDRPAVGIDVGGTKLLAVRLGPDGTVVDTLKEPIRGKDLVEQVSRAAVAVAGGVPGSVGIGVPALVSSDGTILFAPNLQSSIGTRLGELVSQRFAGTRLWIGNDASCAAWGEYAAGAGRGSGEMVMVSLGTGIGGGVVIGGRLFEGVNRAGGEFGHMVVNVDGPPCPCGNRGCWERFASGGALGDMAREAARAGVARRLVELAGGNPDDVGGEHVTAAAAGGDPEALELMARLGRFVAIGIANLVNIFDPRVVVVGGGLIKAGEVLMAPLRASLVGLAMGARERPPVPVVPALLGERSAAVGAGLMALSVSAEGGVAT